MSEALFTTTIAAIATPRGHGGVAVIRLSGPQAWPIALSMFSKPIEPEAGRFYHGWINDGETPLDEVLLLFFKGPNSFTGDDVVEIHGHGGDYLVHQILDLCVHQGAVHAMPGEFSKRAYLNGKVDLTQAESILDLVSAQGEKLLQQASGNLKNRTLAEKMDRFTDSIKEIQAQIVASTDYPDEVDEPDRAPLIASLESLKKEAIALSNSAERNRLFRDGLQVALVGLPNAGKSSLFNALLAQNRSIVTEIEGTTRDVVTETIQISGVPVNLLDTAGLRESGDVVEQLGVARSMEAATSAHLIFYIYDVSIGFSENVLERLPRENCWILANKVDLGLVELPEEHMGVSATTGEGIGQIYEKIETWITSQTTHSDSVTFALNERQRRCLASICVNLEEASGTLTQPSCPIDLVTVSLTDALSNIDELMGRDTREEVLDSVFSQFCVGK